MNSVTVKSSAIDIFALDPSSIHATIGAALRLSGSARPAVPPSSIDILRVPWVIGSIRLCLHQYCVSDLWPHDTIRIPLNLCSDPPRSPCAGIQFSGSSVKPIPVPFQDLLRPSQVMQGQTSSLQTVSCCRPYSAFSRSPLLRTVRRKMTRKPTPSSAFPAPFNVLRSVSIGENT